MGIKIVNNVQRTPRASYNKYKPRENKRYCMSCKKIIPSNASICPSCGKKVADYELVKKTKCKYCNIEIPHNADYCPYCGTSNKNKVDIIDDKSIFDYKSTFVFEEGNAFDKNTRVHVFLKNGKIAFKSFGDGEYMYSIDKDFRMCERFTNGKAKSLKLSIYKDTSYICLTFNDKLFVMKEDETAKRIMEYIYNSIPYSIYETENIFYNANHEKFNIF